MAMWLKNTIWDSMRDLSLIIVIITACLFLSQSQVMGEEQTKPVLPCSWTKEAPQIDGRLDDKLWESLPKVSGFRSISGVRQYREVQTIFQTAYDNNFIYFGVLIREPKMEQLKASPKKHDDVVHSDDSIEIFLGTIPGEQPYYHVIANALGNQYDEMVEKGQIDLNWNPDWHCAVTKGEGFWSIEISIPFADIKKTPSPKERWGFNVTRNRYTEGNVEYSSWAYLSTGFHVPKDFYYLEFASSMTLADKKIEDTVNANYIDAIKSELISAFPQYEKRLKKYKERVIKTGADELKGEISSIETKLSSVRNILQSKEGVSIEEWVSLHEEKVVLRNSIDKLSVHIESLTPVSQKGIPEGVKAGITQQGNTWYLTSSDAVFVIEGSTGILSGIWDRKLNMPYLKGAYDIYRMETLTDTIESDEYQDVVKDRQIKGDSLTFKCVNPDYEGLVLEKEYILEGEGRILTKRLNVYKRDIKEKALFTISSRNTFDKEFRDSSIYQRVLAPGITAGVRMKAKEVTSKVKQTGWQGNTSDACSQFTLTNLKTLTGLAQYQFKIDGKFAFPPRSLNISYWTDYGWEMSWFATFISSEPFSSELRWHLYRGDHLKFYREYLSLSEMQELRNYKVHPAGKRFKGQADNTLAFIWFPYTRSDEIIPFVISGIGHDRLGEYPAGDEEEWVCYSPVALGQAKEPIRRRCLDIKEAGEVAKQKSPSNIYRWVYYFPNDVMEGTPAYRPDWLLINKDGTKVPGSYNAMYHGWGPNWSSGYIDYLCEKFKKIIRYYPLEILYLDTGGLNCMADWGQGRVLQTTATIEFGRKLHKICEENGTVLYINNIGYPYADITHYEGFHWPMHHDENYKKDWRAWFSEPLLMAKFFEPKGAATTIIHWIVSTDPQEDNTRYIANYTLALGFRHWGSSGGKGWPSFKKPDGSIDMDACYRAINPYYSASLEMALTQVTDIDIEPAWWRDETTDIEAYSLVQGGAYILSAINHGKNTKDTQLSVDIKKTGFDRRLPVFSWIFKLRTTTPSQLKLPPTEEWDKLFTYDCGKIEPSKDGTLRVNLKELEPNLVRLSSLTQVPAVIYSAEGKKTQLLLPETLGCKIDGKANLQEKTISLSVSADKPIQILVWLPKEWGNGSVLLKTPEEEKTFSTQELSSFQFGDESFILIDIPKGENKLNVKPTQGE